MASQLAQNSAALLAAANFAQAADSALAWLLSARE
jgi:hypothetical protein